MQSMFKGQQKLLLRARKLGAGIYGVALKFEDKDSLKRYLDNVSSHNKLLPPVKKGRKVGWREDDYI